MAITIRLAQESDAQDLLAIYNFYVQNTAITFDYHSPDLDMFRLNIANISKTYPYLVAQEGNHILGYAYASAFHRRPAYQWLAEVTIYLAPDARGRGTGKRLYQAIEEALQEQGILKSMACIATTTEEDPYLSNTSLAFHEHLGYKIVGSFNQSGYKFGRWYDMKWLEKSLASLPDKPLPIIPFVQSPSYNRYQSKEAEIDNEKN